MTMLGQIAQGRDNNLNLLRVLAATAVLVSHAWPIALGPAASEPLKHQIGYSLGTLSVLVFFAISGYLITASFERRRSNGAFLLARVMRLMPGHAVCLLLTAFVLGPLVTALAAGAYLSEPGPYLFTLRNLSLFSLEFRLPGVFDDQPTPAVVGSIWTLRHEVACYAGVFLAGLAGLWARPGRAALTLGAYAAIWLAVTLGGLTLPRVLDDLLRLSVPFAIGTAFWIWRARLPMSAWGIVLTLALAWATKGGPLYHPAAALAVAYATFWLAFVPGGPIRAYNRLGDYSYGIYIYAFPLQGWAVWAFGPQTPLENVLYSLPPTLLCAVLSWHLVEAPGLAAGTRLAAARAARGGARSVADRDRVTNGASLSTAAMTQPLSAVGSAVGSADPSAAARR